MNRFAKTAVLGLATAAAALAPISQASADHRPYHRHHRINNDALIAGALGLAAGAVIIGSLNDRREPNVIYTEPDYIDPDVDYYPDQPRPRVIHPPLRNPHVVYYRDYEASYEPWSRDWFRYCSNRYRSFNANTGTYRGYDGRDHFCVAG
jgi:BA14K-like protein